MTNQQTNNASLRNHLIKLLDGGEAHIFFDDLLDGFPVEARMGHQVTLEARRRGAIVRPLGDVVVLMPPLAIDHRRLRKLVGIVRDAIESCTAAAELKAAA